MKKLPKILKYLFVSLFLTTVSFFSTNIFALSTDWVVNDNSQVRLIYSKTTSDNNNSIIVGLEYQLAPGWKTYWKSPGGGGFPQNINWDNSENISELDIYWPTPKHFEILGITSIGYEEKVIFPIKIELFDKNKITKINLIINYLVCKDVCIPGNANLYLEIPHSDVQYTDFFYEIEKAKSSLPFFDLKLSSLNKIDTYAVKKKDSVEINIIAESNKNFFNPQIYIHTPFGLPVSKPINEFSIDLKKMKSIFNFNLKNFSNESFPIEILINDKNHNYKFIKNIRLEHSDSNYTFKNKLIYILIISLLGGFILNFMPCVLPVLSIKLMSVLDKKLENVRLSFFYTALGILFSFIILSFFFLILKHLNFSIAWGMQFQEPYFLLFIFTVLTIFTLNTLGLFEISLPLFVKNSNIFDKGNTFFTKNFFNGFFATLLATPCTAPFIGTAITAAFTQGSLTLFLIFVAMGLGMSFPYMIVILFPKIVLLLPKPGKWTIYIKYFLSILLIGTIIWILNILLSFYNFYFILMILVILTILIASFKFNYFKYSVSILCIFFIFLMPTINLLKVDNTNHANKRWLNFEDADIPKLIQNNNLVFIDITADWCATCQFNKINVLQTKKIKEAFEKNQIILIKADWTRPNKEIDAYLKKYNRFGIPFNAFYSLKYPNGLLQSEILSEKQILESIKKIK